ncbi:MAG: methyltransferase [Proteobacteria bacterium]|nr:methyltransferase [Pseudomonadota bacterium]
MNAVTEDRFLDGRVIVCQPAHGFRSGLDAVMLAAAIPARANDDVLELGAGAGVASLCLAARIERCKVTGVEIDPDLVEIASANAETNGVDSRARFVEGNVFDLPRALRKSFDHVLCNPPFHGDEGQRSPHVSRRRAKHDEGSLAQWLETGLKRTVSNGTFSAIVRADRLAETLAALPESGVTVLPLWPKAGEAAKRVIVQVRKGTRAPLTLLPGLVLHEGGGYTKEAEAILRGCGGLDMGKGTR